MTIDELIERSIERNHGPDVVDAIEEIQRLRAEADRLNKYAQGARCQNCEALRLELVELRAKNERPRKAAERYRRLRASHLQTGQDSWIRSGEDLDEAVDAMERKDG